MACDHRLQFSGINKSVKGIEGIKQLWDDGMQQQRIVPKDEGSQGQMNSLLGIKWLPIQSNGWRGIQRVGALSMAVKHCDLVKGGRITHF